MENSGSFQIATDTGIRQQYFDLRAAEYQRTFGFDGSWLKQEDGYDRAGTIIVYIEGGKVLAGARINFCTPASPLRLPMEYGGFTLQTALPEFGLANRRYAEVSRLSVAAERQKGELIIRLLDMLHDYARANETPLVFCICSRKNARLYRIMAANNRMPDKCFLILEKVAMASQYGIDMSLCLFHEKGAI